MKSEKKEQQMSKECLKNCERIAQIRFTQEFSRLKLEGFRDGDALSMASRFRNVVRVSLGIPQKFDDF